MPDLPPFLPFRLPLWTSGNRSFEAGCCASVQDFFFQLHVKLIHRISFIGSLIADGTLPVILILINNELTFFILVNTKGTWLLIIPSDEKACRFFRWQMMIYIPLFQFFYRFWVSDRLPAYRPCWRPHNLDISHPYHQSSYCNTHTVLSYPLPFLPSSVNALYKPEFGFLFSITASPDINFESARFCHIFHINIIKRNISSVFQRLPPCFHSGLHSNSLKAF